MCYRKRLLALFVAIALPTFVLPSSEANGFNLGDLNPFSQRRLARITGAIKPPSINTSLKNINSGSKKILSGTKEILFPWVGPKRTKLPPPPPPTGTRRVYPADARPNS